MENDESDSEEEGYQIQPQTKGFESMLRDQGLSQSDLRSSYMEAIMFKNTKSNNNTQIKLSNLKK